MEFSSLLSEEELERQRSLLALLRYVENECAQAGYPATVRLVALSRDMLQNEVTSRPPSAPGSSGHPRLH